ncbi:MAG: WD40/YVTN/BNR-like repeat-containing protein [Burkholderiales bacterium]
MTTDQATRIFAGAGHFAMKNGERFRGGLFRTSTDDGEWQAVTAGLPENVEARAFLVHPHDSDVIYAGTQDGPYRSTDGGKRWERLGFPDRGSVVWSLAFHPKQPRVMYAGVAPVALYRSEDGGDSWKKLPARSPEHCAMGFPTRTTRIAVDPGRPDDVYAALEVSGVIRSTDGGESWTDLSAPLMKLSEQPHLKSRIGSDIDSEGMLDSHAVAVTGGQVFLAVRMGLFRSDDRGASWRDIEIGRYSPLVYCRDVIVSPHDSKVMYACLSPASRSTDGSLYRSDDVGQSWRRVDHGVKANATMMAVSVHPGDASRVCCVSRCGQVFGTEDSGATWREYRLPAGVQDVYAIACA